MNEWISLLSQDFLIRALIAGIALSCISGSLGVFVIWQRMAFFGDTLAHSGLLGITLAFAFELNFMLGIGIVSVCIAFMLYFLRDKVAFSHDAILGILSPAGLAMGLIALSFFENIQIDLLGFLIGDILAITWQDVWIIVVMVILGLICLRSIWTSLLRLTIDRDIAEVEGVATNRIQMIYIFLLAMIIAVAVKLVGVLLISAMLIIPAATARIVAKSPEQMAVLACVFGMLATTLGMGLAIMLDLPVGPAMVMVLLACFIIILSKRKLIN